MKIFLFAKLGENSRVELYLSPLNRSLPWACRYSMNIPASISVLPTLESQFHHVIEPTLSWHFVLPLPVLFWEAGQVVSLLDYSSLYRLLQRNIPGKNWDVMRSTMTQNRMSWGLRWREKYLAMDDNSCVPDSFYRPAYKLLAQVSSHPLAQVIDVHLKRNKIKHPFISSNNIFIICHAVLPIDNNFNDSPELETPLSSMIKSPERRWNYIKRTITSCHKIMDGNECEVSK